MGQTGSVKFGFRLEKSCPRPNFSGRIFGSSQIFTNLLVYIVVSMNQTQLFLINYTNMKFNVKFSHQSCFEICVHYSYLLIDMANRSFGSVSIRFIRFCFISGMCSVPICLVWFGSIWFVSDSCLCYFNLC